MQSLRRILQLARANAHSACGWLAYKLGWQAKARRQFERVLLLRGADFRAYVHLGRIAFDHGDYAGWRRELEHARRTDPIRFARLRHAIELFEPRLAGTQFEGGHDLDGYQAADSRATWRALHPFGSDPFRVDGRLGKDLGRSHDGFGRGTDLPLAPGYDPLMPSHPSSGQQIDDRDPDDLHDRLLHGDLLDGGGNSGGSNSGGSNSGSNISGDGGIDKDQGISSERIGGNNSHHGWNTPDAALSRDDFSSPIERRRFQLRRPIDRQEIARCDLNELARRLSS